MRAFWPVSIFSMQAGDHIMDTINYWQIWFDKLPKLSMIDVHSSNHFAMLTEPTPLQSIIALCDQLYSQNRATAMDMKDDRTDMAAV